MTPALTANRSNGGCGESVATQSVDRIISISTPHRGAKARQRGMNTPQPQRSASNPKILKKSSTSKQSIRMTSPSIDNQ